MASALERSWYRRRGWSLLLAPLSLVFAVVVGVRRHAYRRGWLASERLPVPVLVIGNITVGGSGKTPLTAFVARRLSERGLKVGIVSRGYGGRSAYYPRVVSPDDAAEEVGDEPLLLARRGHATVAVDPVRARAGRLLVEQCDVDIVVADDGLQHYALARDAEIAVSDGDRGHGNGWLLPAGPLREPRSRLRSVDMQMRRAADGDFWLIPGPACPVGPAADPRNLSSFAGRRVHAVAGIGDPERFFGMLREQGLEVVAHAYPDHHRFRAADIVFDGHAVLMTEKDAVKCASWADERHWYVPVSAYFSPAGEQRLDALLESLAHAALNGRSPGATNEPIR